MLVLVTKDSGKISFIMWLKRLFSKGKQKHKLYIGDLTPTYPSVLST